MRRVNGGLVTAAIVRDSEKLGSYTHAQVKWAICVYRWTSTCKCNSRSSL